MEFIYPTTEFTWEYSEGSDHKSIQDNKPIPISNRKESTMWLIKGTQLSKTLKLLWMTHFTSEEVVFLLKWPDHIDDTRLIYITINMLHVVNLSSVSYASDENRRKSKILWNDFEEVSLSCRMYRLLLIYSV